MTGRWPHTLKICHTQYIALTRPASACNAASLGQPDHSMCRRPQRPRMRSPPHLVPWSKTAASMASRSGAYGVMGMLAALIVLCVGGGFQADVPSIGTASALISLVALPAFLIEVQRRHMLRKLMFASVTRGSALCKPEAQCRLRAYTWVQVTSGSAGIRSTRLIESRLSTSQR